jgi:hypothetical protein
MFQARVLIRIVGPQEGGENCVMKNFVSTHNLRQVKIRMITSRRMR